MEFLLMARPVQTDERPAPEPALSMEGLGNIHPHLGGAAEHQHVGQVPRMEPRQAVGGRHACPPRPVGRTLAPSRHESYLRTQRRTACSSNTRAPALTRMLSHWAPMVSKLKALAYTNRLGRWRVVPDVGWRVVPLTGGLI